MSATGEISVSFSDWTDGEPKPRSKSVNRGSIRSNVSKRLSLSFGSPQKAAEEEWPCGRHETTTEDGWKLVLLVRTVSWCVSFHPIGEVLSKP